MEHGGDILDQYETFNGMPVYYGGDLYDSEDSDWDDPSAIEGETYVEDYNFDVPEGMDLMVHRHHRAPDSSDIRQNWQTDMTPVCRTRPCDTRDEWDMLDDDSLMEAVIADGQNMNEFYQWVVSPDDEDLFETDDGSATDFDMDMSEGEYCVVLDNGSVADLDGDMADEEDCCDSDDRDMLEDCMDSDVWSVTDLDSYRSDVDEEDNCDSDVADLEGLNFLGRNCIMDISAGGTLSPSASDLTDPNGLYATDGLAGQIGMLSPSTSSSEILVDPGGTLPSSDHAGMLLPAMPVGPIGRWGTLPPSDSDLTGPDGPYVTDGLAGQIGTFSPSTSSLEILVDPGRCRHPTSPGYCSRLYLLALLAGEGHCPRPTLTLLARMARLLLVAPSANLGRCPRRPSRRRYWWTLEGRCRHPTSPGCCSRLSLLALLAYEGHCPHLILTLLVRMARMLLVVPLATLGRCPRLPPSPGSWWILVGCSPCPTLL